MCGIVGYLGHKNGLDAVLEGLSRLEYRGYDSSGISAKAFDGKINAYKKEGKLENLRSVLTDKKFDSQIVIGHTRWATHGAVNDKNAHPHSNDDFSIVHNGIIENANALREKLDYNFLSETDTEVFLATLTKKYKECKNVEKAIVDTFSVVEGNSAFVVMSKHDNKMYSIKRSAPLVCGLNKSQKKAFMSSDPYALIGFAHDLYFPEDETLCIADMNDESLISFKDLNLNDSTSYKVQQNKKDMDEVSKGDFDHFMLKEIHQQPALVDDLRDIYLVPAAIKKLEQIKKEFNVSYLHLVACGTALHAGYVIKNFVEKDSHIKVGADFASEFRYKDVSLSSSDVGLFISQSGETADTLACQELCKKYGLRTLSIVNVEGSTLYRECDDNLLIHAGVEIGVASTKAFTQQVLTGLILSKVLTGKLNQDMLKEEFSLLSQRIQGVLDRESEIAKMASQIYMKKGFIFTGRGEQFPIALEGALKLKEIAYVHAEGYAAGELKHGPISLIDEHMVNVAIITPDLYDKTYSNAQEVKARRGVLFVVGEEGNKELINDSDFFFGLNFDGLEHTKPILTNIVLQLLSYHIAKLKGTDIDKPRNLAKSVTVE